MKNLFKISVLTFALVAGLMINAKAQETPAVNQTTTTKTGSGIRLSIGPDLSLPVGSFHDRYNLGFGGSVQADFPIMQDQLFVTVNGGFQNYFAKDINGRSGKDLQMIPAKAGLKYFPVKSFYVQGEAGAGFLTNKNNVGATKSTTFIYAPQIGYLIPLGGQNFLDAGVRFEGNTKFTENGKSNNLFGLRIAYSFSL